MNLLKLNIQLFAHKKGQGQLKMVVTLLLKD